MVIRVIAQTKRDGQNARFKVYSQVLLLTLEAAILVILNAVIDYETTPIQQERGGVVTLNTLLITQVVSQAMGNFRKTPIALENIKWLAGGTATIAEQETSLRDLF